MLGLTARVVKFYGVLTVILFCMLAAVAAFSAFGLAARLRLRQRVIISALTLLIPSVLMILIVVAIGDRAPPGSRTVWPATDAIRPNGRK